MASANLELVRSIYAAWERGDFSSAEWADPDIEYVIADGPTPGRWSGVAGMAEGWRGFLNVWEDYRGVADDFVELDGERIVVPNRTLSGRGKTSGVELRDVQDKHLNVFHLRGGKVTRLVIYWDRDRGFADLGINSEG